MVPPGGQGLIPRGALQEGLPRGQHVQARLGALGVCRPPEQLQTQGLMSKCQWAGLEQLSLIYPPQMPP